MTGDAKTIALLSAGIALASAMHFWMRDAVPVMPSSTWSKNTRMRSKLP